MSNQNDVSASGSPAEEFSPLLPGPRLFLASNGSVVIHAADPSHQGQYMCQVSNGIGSGLSKSIFLRVNGENSYSSCNFQVEELKVLFFQVFA